MIKLRCWWVLALSVLVVGSCQGESTIREVVVPFGAQFPFGARDKRETPASSQQLDAESDLPSQPDATDDLSSPGNDSTLPSAEKFIGFRRKKKDQQDILREKMIGMIFTGEPEPLGYRPRLKIGRRRFRTRSKFPLEHQHQRRINDYRAYDTPSEILKPLSFVPLPNNLQFAVPHLESSASRATHEFSRPSSTSHVRFRSNFGQRPRGERQPDSRNHKLRRPISRPNKPRPPPHQRDRFSNSKDIFSNTVGPDFGPVTFDDFGSNFDSNFNINSHQSPKKPHKPLSSRPHKPHYFKPSDTIDERPPFGFSDTKFGGFSVTETFDEFSEVNDGSECHKYTADICLDTDNYPHEEILSSLAQDPGRVRTLMAEVRDQSADELVDGLTSEQEDKYDYSHYFGSGNRRQDTVTPTPRDFASDGGYLCPSEVKYARPKRARNSKGGWKFIVNMEKYSQTIRMEKCMKPGGSCSYVSHHYRATCNQIYNYQRLLSWEKKKGLHMDIFKVPSCCSCHIMGYAFVFPPLSTKKGHQFSGSERVEERVSFTRKDLNMNAPPYSPVNFPNLPQEGNPRPRNSHQDVSQRRRRPPGSHPAGPRNDSPEHRVNYDYHPIIDFFENS